MNVPFRQFIHQATTTVAYLYGHLLQCVANFAMPAFIAGTSVSQGCGTRLPQDDPDALMEHL